MHLDYNMGFCNLQVHSIEEVEEFSKIASILYINVGTLSKDWVEAMKLAAAAYTRQGKLWVLDPVAAGATEHRTKVVRYCTVFKSPNASAFLALFSFSKLA